MFSFDNMAGNALKERALSNDNVFSSPKGLPYFSDMAFNRLIEEEENAGNGDEIEMHIDEDLQA